MTTYIVRRLFALPVTLFGLTVLIFALLGTLSPVERATAYVRTDPKTPDEMQRIVEKYGLDQPFYIQYGRWLNELAHGNLGFSKSAAQPVASALLAYFPASLELTVWSLLPVFVGGIWLGSKAATHHNRLFDRAARVLSVTAFSFPGFVFAMVALLIFYAALQWFPPGRLSDWANTAVLSSDFHRYTGMNTVDAIFNLRPDIFADALRHLVLPALTLSYGGWALLMRLMRSSMLEALRQDYTTTARAKGLRERYVINKHAMPNALIPIVTVSALLFAGLLSGGGIVETVFDYRGMGWWAVDAALHLDVVSVLGITLLNGAVLVLVNLAVDVAYAFLDPRIRFN